MPKVKKIVGGEPWEVTLTDLSKPKAKQKTVVRVQPMSRGEWAKLQDQIQGTITALNELRALGPEADPKTQEDILARLGDAAKAGQALDPDYLLKRSIVDYKPGMLDHLSAEVVNQLIRFIRDVNEGVVAEDAAKN